MPNQPDFGGIVRRARRAVIMTGGGPGIMEAAKRGAFEAGAESIGLNIDLPRAQMPNRYTTLRLSFRYFALRKLHFLLRARAMVAFPGGFGTFDELFIAARDRRLYAYADTAPAIWSAVLGWYRRAGCAL